MAGEVLHILRTDPRQMATIARGIERAVRFSFTEDKSRATGDEMRRRAALCMKFFREARNDLKWGIERIVDSMPRALRSKLDGVPFDPTAEKRTLWAPPKIPAALSNR